MILKISDFIKSSWFWFISGLILLFFFVFKGHSFIEVFYFISFLLPVIIGTSYYLNNRLIPHYLLRKRHALFILYSIYTLIISLYFQYLIIFIALYIFTAFQLTDHSILHLNVGNLSLSLYILVLLNVLIEIIKKLNQKEIIIQSLKEVPAINGNALDEKILIRYNRMNHQISLSEIIYIESLSDYIKIITIDDEIVSKEKISKIIERLPIQFIRTHRSFIVNSNRINKFNKEFVSLGPHQIPISRSFKSSVYKILNQD